MAPHIRIKCKECTNVIRTDLGKKRHSGKSLWMKIQCRDGPDEVPYLESDWFCSKCRHKILSGQFPPQCNVHQNMDNENQLLQAEEEPEQLSEPTIATDAMVGDYSMENEVLIDLEDELIPIVETVYSRPESSMLSCSEPILPTSSFTPINQHNRLPFICSKTILKNTKTIPHSEKSCCVCKSTESRHRIPQNVRLQFWNETRIWIPTTNRCCLNHYINGKLSDESMQILQTQSKIGASLTDQEVEDWIHQLTDSIQRAKIDLDSQDMDDSDYQLLFALNKDQFEDLLNHINGNLRPTIHRTPRNALAIFMMKIRLGISQRMLGYLFGLSQKKVSSTIQRVASLLDNHFVPNNFGFSHVSREDILKYHDSEFVRKLHDVSDDCIVLVLDGTYLYVEKSSDHRVQRKTYSMQKGRNLLKVMVVVTPTGYIVDCFGIYFSDGHHNDAKILGDMLQKDDNIGQFVQPGDLLIMDRGFRDIIKDLEKRKLRTVMPHLLGKNQKQFSTQQANESRKVTLCRWVVEAVNGRLKNMFKFFDNVIPAHYFNIKSQEKLNRYLRISCAVMNKFCPPIFEENEKHDVLLASVKRHEEDENLMMEEVLENESEMVRQTKCWVKTASENFMNFPKLTMEELKDVTLGKFQIENARGYTDEQFDDNQEYIIQTHKTRPGLIRVKVQAKFRNAGSHFLWIKYCMESDTSKIVCYYCQCQGGAKSIGSCSHVTSVLWFLCYRRHQLPVYRPRRFGEDIIEIVKRKVSANEDYANSANGSGEDSD